MSNSIVKSQADLARKLTGGLTSGSLADIVKAQQIEEETFILLDYSSSMDENCSGSWDSDGDRKIDALRRVANDLKSEVNCRHIGFGGYPSMDHNAVRFLDHEPIPEPEGGTPLAFAIRFAKGNGGKHLVVVSDGAPDNEHDAMTAAKEFGGPIDVFYVGPRNASGERFLKELANATKGSCSVTSLKNTKEITAGIRGLLSAGPSKP